MERQQHWDSIYETESVTNVSWYEAEPQASLDLIETASPTHGSVIDVGGGASILVDRLLAVGFNRVAVLDISAAALEHAKLRLGAQAGQVQWLVADITETRDLGQFDVWHDRAGNNVYPRCNILQPNRQLILNIFVNYNKRGDSCIT